MSKGTKFLTDKDLGHLCTGRVTVREVITYRPRLHSFRTRYAAQTRGKLLKTKSGLYFATRQQALDSGRKCIGRLREHLLMKGHQ